MTNCFQYVEFPEQHSVLLRLFTATDGNPQGDVFGPGSGSFGASNNVVELVRCSSLDDAFAAGIRMANKNDTDLVISGDAALWRSAWGVLERAPCHRLTLAS